MASAEEIFSLSGPIHLTAIDWNNICHRRSVVASLVKGVYMIENDRRQNRHGPQAFALPWWDFFRFRLNHMLIDDVDLSICGAIYEYKYPSPALYYYISHNILLPFVAQSWNQTQFSLSRGASMWLTGHSLGSAMALLVGKNMAKIGYFLETVVKAGLMVSVKGRKHRKAQAYDPFVVLSPWVPYLFVNPDDPICSEYIGYFEHRKKMEEIGVRRIERLATLSLAINRGGSNEEA
ncbi:GDSL esterase/lipase At4g10955-like [Quercus suber]|uniref:GDSL esterase/lipase At4g10955-like n=1 Tax=Quercus suber TaxID=58331 RepID=UPI0032DEE3EB